jgi:hypothetical protein
MLVENRANVRLLVAKIDLRLRHQFTWSEILGPL